MEIMRQTTPTIGQAWPEGRGSTTPYAVRRMVFDRLRLYPRKPKRPNHLTWLEKIVGW